MDGEIGFVYGVSLKRDGEIIQPDGTLTVRLRIPENLQGKNFNVIRIHGESATDIEYTVDGNYAVITTDTLVEFVLVGINEPADTANTLWIVLISILAVVVALEISYIAVKAIRKKNTTEGIE